MSATQFAGAYTALVTPFSGDGSQIDWPAYERLVDAQLAGGITGLVPCGTTGETPTLSDDEQRQLVERTVRLAKGKASVIVGTGSNSTKKTIESSVSALEAGADGVMIVMPYYNKPSQEGMVRHVELVAKSVRAPIVLYNIPGRTGVELSVESLLRILQACDNVVAIKDATGNVLYCQELVRRAGDRISVLSGDDALTIPQMSVGAKGVISVTSNVYPRQISECVADALAGRWDDARRKHLAMLPVHAALFMEPNPQPAKAALALKGQMQPGVRAPLVEASEACKKKLADVMAAYEAGREAS